MRLAGILALLVLMFQVQSQYIPGSKIINLDEAVTAAILRHPSLPPDSEKTLIADVESAYLEYVYLVNRYHIFRQHVCLISDMERIANLRYNTGDIDLVQKTSMISGLEEIRTAIDMMDDELSICTNNLKILLLTSEELVPADSILTLYAIQKRGANIPADTSSRFIFEEKLENIESELNRNFKKIRYFKETALVRADILLESSLARLRKEDIDYIEYAGNVGESFNIRLEYLQTLKNYNKTAIQLELFAY
jgi:hypothetical protein